jgi:hypothetical protein
MHPSNSRARDKVTVSSDAFVPLPRFDGGETTIDKVAGP